MNRGSGETANRDADSLKAELLLGSYRVPLNFKLLLYGLFSGAGEGGSKVFPGCRAYKDPAPHEAPKSATTSSQSEAYHEL